MKKFRAHIASVTTASVNMDTYIVKEGYHILHSCQTLLHSYILKLLLTKHGEYQPVCSGHGHGGGYGKIIRLFSFLTVDPE